MSAETVSNISEADKRANIAIRTMVVAAIGGAVVPVVISWPVFATATGAGVVAIGMCYGVSLTTSEAWKLIVQFIRAAGLTFAGLAIGMELLSFVFLLTGAGYFVSAGLESVLAGSIAYAIGAAAKVYFKGERDNMKLGQVLRDAFQKKRDGQAS